MFFYCEDLFIRKSGVMFYIEYIYYGTKRFKYFKNNLNFNLKDILTLYKNKKNFFSINSHLVRNEGYNLNTGQKMWKRAKNIIPGGTMLFSKNPDLFLPKFWPAYFEKTKGCNIWDLEGKKYLDLSIKRFNSKLSELKENDFSLIIDRKVGEMLINNN